MIKRRTLIASTLLAAAPARPVLSVGTSDRAHLEASLWLPSGAVFTLPPSRATLIAVVRLRAMEITAVSFAFDTVEARQDLLALVGANGQLLALERLRWKTAHGDALESHFAMMPDRVHLTFERNIAIHGSIWRREAWTDYLALAQGRLVDCPPRVVQAGTWQALMARERGLVADGLQPTPTMTRAVCEPFRKINGIDQVFDESPFAP